MQAIIDEMTKLCFEHEHAMHSKHIAVLTKNAKPIINYVYNEPLDDSSLHAEIAAIKHYLKGRRLCLQQEIFKKNRKIFSNCLKSKSSWSACQF